jgi:hypothetical protein
MLPASVGSHSQERAAFQEAGHAVMFRILGGQISELEIILDFRTNVWEGAMAPVNDPVGEQEIQTAFAGPLAEAMLVANLYPAHPPADWTIDKAASVPVLASIVKQPGPFAIQFAAGGQIKSLLMDKEMFGGDWLRAERAAQQNSIPPARVKTLLEETIDYVSRADVWDAIGQVAVELLKLRPHLLVWKIEQSASGNNRINDLIDGIVKKN